MTFTRIWLTSCSHSGSSKHSRSSRVGKAFWSSTQAWAWLGGRMGASVQKPKAQGAIGGLHGTQEQPPPGPSPLPRQVQELRPGAVGTVARSSAQGPPEACPSAWPWGTATPECTRQGARGSGHKGGVSGGVEAFPPDSDPVPSPGHLQGLPNTRVETVTWVTLTGPGLGSRAVVQGRPT